MTHVRPIRVLGVLFGTALALTAAAAISMPISAAGARPAATVGRALPTDAPAHQAVAAVGRALPTDAPALQAMAATGQP